MPVKMDSSASKGLPAKIPTKIDTVIKLKKGWILSQVVMTKMRTKARKKMSIGVMFTNNNIKTLS